MSATDNGNLQGRNRLLASIPLAEYERLRSRAEHITFGIKMPVYEADESIAQIYFPLSGVFSLVTEMEDGTSMEVATVGNEGLVGLPAFLGSETSPLTTFSQVPGDALRLDVADFHELAGPGSGLHGAIHRYTQALFTLTAQSVACNRLHAIEARCARWLLMTHDRVQGDEYPLTHEFLAQMLGVRRASVSEVAASLQAAGLIRYQRGVVTILDRAGLEAVACECYGIIKREFDRLVG